MTVMTTRSHAGSVIKNSRIELIHHRRHTSIDSIGELFEGLNELDDNKSPISVASKYYL